MESKFTLRVYIRRRITKGIALKIFLINKEALRVVLTKLKTYLPVFSDTFFFSDNINCAAGAGIRIQFKISLVPSRTRLGILVAAILADIKFPPGLENPNPKTYASSIFLQHPSNALID